MITETKAYIYETHLHTSEGSRCAKKAAEECVEYMMAKGYHGVIITDHFYNGTTAVPLDLPWAEWVEQYCRGYENAKKAAEGTDFKVFFGVEYNYNGDEYLLYGIDKKWLIAHPDMLNYSKKELFHAVSEAGGIMIHAHPYRERYYLNAIYLSPENCHGIEVYNAQNESYQNALAREYGVKYNLPFIGGSDMHFKKETILGGVKVSHPLEDIQDFVDAFKAGELVPVSIRPDGTVVEVDTLDEECVVSKGPTNPVSFVE